MQPLPDDVVSSFLPKHRYDHCTALTCSFFRCFSLSFFSFSFSFLLFIPPPSPSSSASSLGVSSFLPGLPLLPFPFAGASANISSAVASSGPALFVRSAIASASTTPFVPGGSSPATKSSSTYLPFAFLFFLFFFSAASKPPPPPPPPVSSFCSPLFASIPLVS